MQPLSLETSRLHLSWLSFDDAEFIFTLVNDPDWIRFIGNKNVVNLDDARRYIETGPMQMYRKHGFGLNRVALKQDNRPIGICGILKRDSLDNVDLGFALLPEFRDQGYAFEAAQAVLEQICVARPGHPVAAILSPLNTASAKLLKKLGFSYHGEYQAEPNADILDLYLTDMTKTKS